MFQEIAQLGFVLGLALPQHQVLGVHHFFNKVDDLSDGVRSHEDHEEENISGEDHSAKEDEEPQEHLASKKKRTKQLNKGLESSEDESEKRQKKRGESEDSETSEQERLAKRKKFDTDRPKDTVRSGNSIRQMLEEKRRKEAREKKRGTN